MDHENIDKLDSEVIEIIRAPVDYKNKIDDMVPLESTIYGREDDQKKIVEFLLSDDHKNHDVNFISVVSDRGIGKTTMLQLIYNNEIVCSSFDTRLFISMPENFNEKMLFRMTIESITRASCDATELGTLEKILKEELAGKKFLLFLDNFDSKDQRLWNIPLVLLNFSMKGSVIVVSTRWETFSNMRRPVQCYYYHLNPLSDHWCRMIFHQFALCGQYADNEPNLVEIGKQLVAKCGNITLCMKVLSCLLRHSKKEEWLEIISGSSSCEMNEMCGNVLPVLRICYNVLPPHLKRCFKYCSLYPKNYLFSKHLLVLMWLSQGFIEPIEGRELEEIGLEYFEELLSRSLFQYSPFHKTEEGMFVMCGLIHDLAQHVSMNEFVRLEQIVQRVPDNACHLSIVPHEYEVVSLKDLTTEMQNLQSFLVVGRIAFQQESLTSPIMNLGDLDDIFKKCVSLVTLDLSNTDIEQLPNSIGLLKSLHYLGLSGTKIMCIPSEISNLVSLETFEAKNCHYLEELPQDIQELTNLRHLDVNKESGFTIMPCGIGKLTNLRSLPAFSIMVNHCGIEELKNLVYLKGNLQISGLENVRNGKDANLKNKIFLENLCLLWSEMIVFDETDTDITIAEDVLENLEPSYNLGVLIIRNYPGKTIPTWIESFPKLVSLILDGCYNCENLPNLGELPMLRYLSIQKMYPIQKISLFNGFPSLEVLNIWEMYELEEWVETKDGDFPFLHTLSINRCPLLRNVPCFQSLLELSIYNCTHLPEIIEMPSLESLKIEGFQKTELIKLPTRLVGLKKLEIKHCPELLLVEGLNLTCVEKIKIIGCPSLDMSKNQPSVHLNEKNDISVLSRGKEIDLTESLQIDLDKSQLPDEFVPPSQPADHKVESKERKEPELLVHDQNRHIFAKSPAPMKHAECVIRQTMDTTLSIESSDLFPHSDQSEMSEHLDVSEMRDLQQIKAIRMAFEIQKRLHEELVIQKRLHLSIEEQAMYMKKLLEEQNRSSSLAAINIPQSKSLPNHASTTHNNKDAKSDLKKKKKKDIESDPVFSLDGHQSEKDGESQENNKKPRLDVKCGPKNHI